MSSLWGFVFAYSCANWCGYFGGGGEPVPGPTSPASCQTLEQTLCPLSFSSGFVLCCVLSTAHSLMNLAFLRKQRGLASFFPEDCLAPCHTEASLSLLPASSLSLLFEQPRTSDPGRQTLSPLEGSGLLVGSSVTVTGCLQAPEASEGETVGSEWLRVAWPAEDSGL